jgi:hypothetical protein
LKPDLDRLLRSLHDATPEHPRLPELEPLLWRRLAIGEVSLFWQRFGFHVRVTAVLGAFLWGMLIGAQGISIPSSTAQSGELFIEPAEFLAPDDVPF